MPFKATKKAVQRSSTLCSAPSLMAQSTHKQCSRDVLIQEPTRRSSHKSPIRIVKKVAFYSRRPLSSWPDYPEKPSRAEEDTRSNRDLLLFALSYYAAALLYSFIYICFCKEAGGVEASFYRRHCDLARSCYERFMEMVFFD